MIATTRNINAHLSMQQGRSAKLFRNQGSHPTAFRGLSGSFYSGWMVATTNASGVKYFCAIA